jgi:hypothetical protein
MNPLEKEISRQDPTGKLDSFTFTEKELLALLDECVEFEMDLRPKPESVLYECDSCNEETWA